MSGMVLIQLLNPESGIDRQSADKALDGVGPGRPESGPSRYDEVVRQQEKRLEQKRAEERAAERNRQQEAAQRADESHPRESTAEASRPEEKTGQAANDRRPDSEANDRAEKKNTGSDEAPSDRVAAESDGQQNTDNEAPVAAPGLVESLVGADDAGIVALSLQGQSQLPASSASKADGGQSAAQVMASLTGTGQNQNGLPTTGKLFTAMLEAGQDKGAKQGRDLLAGLQGGGVQTLTDATGKAADSLTAQVAARLAAPEFTQSLNQATSMRGLDAQALMKNYSTSVDVPVGADEWGEKVMGKLAWLTASQMSVAEIHITPPDMGPLEVRVQVQNDQAAVTVHATTPAVREQLELHGHRLRDMLNEQGLSLSGFDVSDSPGREAMDQQGEGDGSGDGGSRQGVIAGSEELAEQDMVETGELDLSWKGQLDLYA